MNVAEYIGFVELNLCGIFAGMICFLMAEVPKREGDSPLCPAILYVMGMAIWIIVSLPIKG